MCGANIPGSCAWETTATTLLPRGIAQKRTAEVVGHCEREDFNFPSETLSLSNLSQMQRRKNDDGNGRTSKTVRPVAEDESMEVVSYINYLSLAPWKLGLLVTQMTH